MYTESFPKDCLSIKEASAWASLYLKVNISQSNISYLVQYGRIGKIVENGIPKVSKNDLIEYYKNKSQSKKVSWSKSLGDDLNWSLSFEQYKEYETTKHVHRLHPYKGKFIPQLVEYFLDGHIDKYKKNVFFESGDTVLDPFCGSGTTLVQANELGMHAIGIDVSSFNSLISNIKIRRHNLEKVESEIKRITKELEQCNNNSVLSFENSLSAVLKELNAKHFPTPDYRYKLQQKKIDENSYSRNKEKTAIKIFNDLIASNGIKLLQSRNSTFLDKWYLHPVRIEIDLIFSLIKKIKDPNVKKVLCLILSRTVRSCRATTHSDLATLLKPQVTPYYCKKHGKICKPLFSLISWWKRYSIDTIKRLKQYEELRTETHQICLTGDSRAINITNELDNRMPDFSSIVKREKIKGIFSSPPYVGLIDYHEQHAYAYDLFGFTRNDQKEIGPLFQGQGLHARKSYINGVSTVLKNCKKFLCDDFSIFLVANDKWGMYPEIADKAELKIVDQFKRPVVNRTEKDKGAYSESIFHLKNNKFPDTS